jgi:hypothetical protein
VRVRIPVQVFKLNSKLSSKLNSKLDSKLDSKIDNAAASAAEQTVIEFGTPGEVIFASGLPLDFEDTVRMKNFDGSFDVSAEIIAMQLDQGKTAVAARFLDNVTNWIIK